MNTIPEMQAKLDALQQKPAVRILAMESSCDETAAAIIENGRKIVSSVIFSRIFIVNTNPFTILCGRKPDFLPLPE